MKQLLDSKDQYKDFLLPLLFLQLYGERGALDPYHGTTFSEYKKNILKLVDTIKVSILQSIDNTDNFHSIQLNKLVEDCKTNIKRAKTMHTISTSMVTFQTEVILCILGNIPYNSGKVKVTNQPGNWKLDTFRNIFYTQNREQKFNLLRHAIHEGFCGDELPNYKTAISKYQISRHKGEDLFDWFKRMYPSLFIQIFDIH